MCSGRGEGPSLLGVLECLFPLGHCSLNTDCRNTAHSSNSAAWLGEKQEKYFPGRNLLSNERLYLGVRRRGRNWRAWCGAFLCTGKGSTTLFSLWWWLAMFTDPALCPISLGRGREGQGPAVPWHGSQLLLSCKCWICWKSGCTVPFWGTVYVQHINCSVPMQCPSFMLWLMRHTGSYSDTRSKFSE